MPCVPSIWEEVQNSQRYKDFAAIKGQWNVVCSTCPWLEYCHGDCPKNRRGGATVSSPSRQLSHLCEGWKRFYTHAIPRMKELAQDIRRAQLEQLLKRYSNLT